uniref:Uncharacterized protein n=1 Tax=Anas platyrhynchos platyrhynchos TaxID=8840 RepID=A0A493T7H4_ANAPP
IFEVSILWIYLFIYLFISRSWVSQAQGEKSFTTSICFLTLTRQSKIYHHLVLENNTTKDVTKKAFKTFQLNSTFFFFFFFPYINVELTKIQLFGTVCWVH